MTVNAWVNGPKDLLVGLLYMVVGAGAFALSHMYDMGTPLQMGPGYFPALVGVVLFGLGVLSIFIAFGRKEPDPIVQLSIEPLALVVAGGLSFSFLIERAGLVVAIAALLFFACFRRLLTNPIEVVLTFAVLAVFSALVFVYGFGMPIPLFWWQQ